MIDIIKNQEFVSKSVVKMGSGQSFTSGGWGTPNADGELIEASGNASWPLYQIFLNSSREDVAVSGCETVICGGYYQAITDQFGTATYTVGKELIVKDSVLIPCPAVAGTYHVVGIFIKTDTAENEIGNTVDVIVFDRKDYLKIVA